jgi:hypothetical protein
VQQQRERANRKESEMAATMLPFRMKALLLCAMCFLLFGASVSSQDQAHKQNPPSIMPYNSERLSKAIRGLKASEQAMYLYERIERTESRKNAHDPQPYKIEVARAVPAGTGIDHIPLNENGLPSNSAMYRAELEKLLKSLQWAAQSGEEQKEAYEKVDKKLKQRDDLIEATRRAFIFTYVGSEERAGRELLEYRMDPNPSFQPANRSESFLTKVQGHVWIDEQTSQLARIQGKIVKDITFGLILGKIYKGSTFMQERYEVAPGLWLPSYTQYDFDGRKFFSSISIHDKTFYSHYRRVGPPSEALPMIRAELASLKNGGGSGEQGADP